MTKRLLIPILLLCSFSALRLAAQSDAAAVASMQKKLDYIQSNGARTKPDPKPTQFTEREVNAYLASSQVKLPQGVQSLHLQGQPDVVTGTARVDFDQLKAGQRSGNPLLSMFTGVHDVTVVAHARGIDYQGHVQVDSAALDGVEIPRFVLELFVEKYLQPRYPGIGMNSQFKLPAKINSADVGQHEVTIIQK